MRIFNPQGFFASSSERFLVRQVRLGCIFLLMALGLAGCASFDSPYQTTDRSDRYAHSLQQHRYSVMDDWFWRSRYFDHYYSAAYAGYGVWYDPWLMWTLRSGRYGGFGHWQFDPFYSPWRGIGSRFAWSGFGFGSGWGHGYPYFAYSNYGYRNPTRVVNGRGLATAPSSAGGADQAFLLLQQSQRRNAPDYGSRTQGNIGSGFSGGSAIRTWGMPSRQSGQSLPMEMPSRLDGGGLPSAEQRRSAFPSDMGEMRDRGSFERSERRFEPSQRQRRTESPRGIQDE